MVASFQSHFKNVIALLVHIAADQGGRTNKNSEKMFTKKGVIYKVVRPWNFSNFNCAAYFGVDVSPTKNTGIFTVFIATISNVKKRKMLKKY